MSSTTTDLSGLAASLKAMREPSTEASLREFAKSQLQMAIAAVRRAKERRRWLAKLAQTNPGAVAFYPEHLDLLSKEIAFRRANARRARKEAAEMAAAEFRELIEAASLGPVFEAIAADVRATQAQGRAA